MKLIYFIQLPLLSDFSLEHVEDISLITDDLIYDFLSRLPSANFPFTSSHTRESERGRLTVDSSRYVQYLNSLQLVLDQDQFLFTGFQLGFEPLICGQGLFIHLQKTHLLGGGLF